MAPGYLSLAVHLLPLPVGVLIALAVANRRTL